MPAPSISDALGRAGGESTEVADQGGDLGDAFARLHIGQDEGAVAARILRELIDEGAIGKAKAASAEKLVGKTVAAIKEGVDALRETTKGKVTPTSPEEHEVIVQETLLRAPDWQMFESAD